MISKEAIVFVVGILLIIIPFLGIPESWRFFIIAFLGLTLVVVGYALRRKVYLSAIDRGNGERGTNSFVETTEPLFD